MVTAAKTTDVEGRLSALLQETKELKVDFGEMFIYCIFYEMNSRKFYFISFSFSNPYIFEECSWGLMLSHNMPVPILMNQDGTNENFLIPFQIMLLDMWNKNVQECNLKVKIIENSFLISL